MPRLYSKKQVAWIVVFACSTLSIVAFAGSAVWRAVAGHRAAAASAESELYADELHVVDSEGAPSGAFAFNAASGDISYTQDELQNIAVYEQANEAVVNITTQMVGINWFLEPVPQEGGTGSGSIIDERGYVLTNRHVISDAVRIIVSLHDGSQYEAKVVGVDKENDIAVIKFEPEKGAHLRTIPYGDSSTLKVGQRCSPSAIPSALTGRLRRGLSRL